MLTQYQDLELVKRFLTLPEIRRYAFENDNAGEVDLTGIWLGYNGYGLINLHATSGCSMDIHGYILRANRGDYSAMMDEGLSWFKLNTDVRWVKVACHIPVVFKSTVSIAHNRMSFEGLSRASYLHNNEPQDVVSFGLLKSQIVVDSNS